MAAYLDKQKINTAITENTHLNLNHDHVSTLDFFQANVSYIHEMVPGEHIKISQETFARMNPLVVPTFGRATMRHRAFFVPFRTVFRGWGDFITDAVHIPSDYSLLGHNSVMLDECPTVTNGNLVQAFMDANFIGSSTINDPSKFVYTLVDQTSQVYDIYYSGTKYNLTVYGRQAMKILEQLGYKLNFDSKFDDVVFNAMPLLAFGKAFTDWYFAPQYRNTSTYDYIQAMCNQDVSSGAITLSFFDVHAILQVCMFVMYDSSYFVSAWDQPNEPTPGNFSNFKIVNVDSIGHIYGGSNYTNITSQNGVSNNSDVAINTGDAVDRFGKMNAPFITGYVNGQTSSGSNNAITGGISEYLLHALHAMTDYMKRHQLAGSRAMDRYLARFGKALAAEKLNRSVYIGSNLQNLQIGDVMSTASTVGVNGVDTGGAELGSFAGKGISYGNGSFDFSTDEFGYIIIITSLVPDTSYYQGIDRQVMRTTKLQFFTPEYDSLSTQPITAAELFISKDYATTMVGNPYEQVFGWTPRYADYKVAHDQLTGNFRLNSINGGTEELSGSNNASGSWHLMRVFKPQSDFNFDYANCVHSLDFVSGASDFSQYKRIFYNDDWNSPDNITIIHNFKIDSYAPMKALYDEYEFEDKGKKITLETNGVKLN